MPVILPDPPNEAGVSLVGIASAEDAEALQAWLVGHPTGPVILTDCDSLHTACLQVLMAAGCPVTGAPTDPALALLVAQALSPPEAAAPTPPPTSSQ